MSSLPKLIVVLGPTASGKTKLAIKLANKFNGVIISADSRQIYKDMNIGTGKDISAYKQTPFALINIITPDKQLTLAQYKNLAIEKINTVIQQNKIPFLVGGTGLYLSSIIENYQLPNIAPDKKIRARLEKMSTVEKIKQLKILNPNMAKNINLKNPRHLNRALEISLVNRKINNNQKNKPLYQTLILGIDTDRNQLIKKINQRVELMFKQGLINETKKIIKRYGKKSQPLSTIGYAEIIDYLDKKITINQATELIKIHTRQYAKRQKTWFKRIENINWITTMNQANNLIKKFLEKNN